MRKFFSFILFYIYIGTASLYAQYQDKGINGRLGFLYEDENYNLRGLVNEQKKFTQEYELNYEGNIYNPNLLEYRISTLLRFDNTKQKTGESDGKTDLRSRDYRIDADFIKNSNFPFKIYYTSSNRPTSTIYADTAINLLSQVNNYGLTGLVKLDRLQFDYEVSKDTSTDEDDKRFLERTITKYGGTVRYKNRDDNIQFRALHTQTDSRTITLDTAGSQNDSDDTLGLSYGTKISKTLRLSSSLGYSKTTIGDGTISNAGVNLNWKPSSDYDGTLAISFSRVDFYLSDELNSSSSQKSLSRTDTLNINQNLNYRPTKELSFSQGIDYFSNKQTTNDTETASLNLDANYIYNNQLTSERALDFSSSLSSIMQNSKNRDTNGTVDSTRESMYYMRAKVGISEKLPSINSRLGIGTRYNGTRTSKVSVDEYGADFSLLSRLGIFSNSLRANYTLSGVVTTISYGDTINFAARVGYRGYLSGGVSYNTTETSGSKSDTKSQLCKADLNFRYRFFRKLMFSTGANISKDLGYNTLVYGGNSKLEYKRGLTKIGIEYRYNHATAELSTGQNAASTTLSSSTNSTRKSLQAKFERKF